MSDTAIKRKVKMWDVTVAPHFIEPRYTIPALTYRLGALDRKDAIKQGALYAAKEAGVPGWRPWLRELAKHVTATLDIVEVNIS